MKWPDAAKQYQGKPQTSPISLFTEPRGMNTIVPARALNPSELVQATNWRYNDVGQLETRPGVSKQTSAACGAAIKTIAKVPIGLNTYYLIVDSDNKLYAVNSGSSAPPTLNPGSSIATLDGAARIIPFNSFAVILDGGYIKTYDGTTLRIAYDDGDGAEAFQYNNTCGTSSTSATVYQKLYTGSKTRAANQITTPDTGSYTMPVTTIKVWLSKSGSPTGTIYAKVWNDSTGAVVDTSTTTVDVDSELTTSGREVTLDFAGSVYLSSNTAYKFGVQLDSTSSDASNYVVVHASSTGSSGKTYYYDGSWTNVATSNLLLGVKPNVPPKASFGDVKESRLFTSGGLYPGYIYYSNINSVFDWSSTDGGGYVSAIDDDANSFPVGGIRAHYGDLFILGKSSQPYLAKLTGSSPSTYAVPPLFQQTYADHKSLLSIVNDVWFATTDGVYNMSGVTSYGDIRAANIGGQIADKLQSYWDTDSFAGFNPIDGQVLIKLTGYDNVLVGHTRLPIQDRTGKTTFPWTEYDFSNTDTSFTPTAFASFDGEFWIGGSNGHLYKIDSSQVEDDATLPAYSLKSGIVESPFGTMEVRDYYISCYSGATASGKISFYVNGSSKELFDTTFYHRSYPMQEWLKFNAESLQVQIDQLKISETLSLQGITFNVRKLSRRGM